MSAVFSGLCAKMDAKRCGDFVGKLSINNGNPTNPKRGGAATCHEPKWCPNDPQTTQNDIKYAVWGSKMSATNGTTKKNTAL